MNRPARWRCSDPTCPAYRWQMTLYATDESGEPICVDCLHGACITMAWECRAEHCRCGCRTATEASRQAARDLEAEVRPLHALMIERYGRLR